MPISINRCNEVLGRELGRNPHGEAVFTWRWSDDLFHWMPTGEYDYEAVPGSVLVLPRAKLQRRLAAPFLRRQWVLCRWVAPEMDRVEWEQSFGTRYPWPRHGQWVPTNIALPEGYTPGDSVRGQVFNDRLIGIIKEQLKKTVKQLNDEAVAAVEKEEAAAEKLIGDAIADAMPKLGRFVPPPAGPPPAATPSPLPSAQP